MAITNFITQDLIFFWIAFVAIVISIVLPIKWYFESTANNNTKSAFKFLNFSVANIFYNIANSIYFYRGIYGISSYNLIKGAAEICFVVYALFLFIYLKDSLYPFLKKDRAAVYLTWIFWFILLIICFNYILIPFITFYPKAGRLSLLLKFTANSYTLLFVGATALAIMGGFLTSNLLDFMLCVSIVLQYTSDFAIRFYMANHGNETITSFEALSVFAWIVQALVLIFYSIKNQRPFATKLMPISSERFWYAIRPSVSSIVVICFLIAVIAPTSSSFSVTLISTALTGLWIFFNFHSLKFSNGILTITAEAVKNGISNYFGSSDRTGNIPSILKRLAPKTEELRVLLYETVKYAEDKSQEKYLIDFGKHATVMAHQIDPSICLLNNRIDALGLKYKAFNDDEFLHTRQLVQRIVAYHQRLSSPINFTDGNICDLSTAIQSAITDSQKIYSLSLDVNIQYTNHVKKGVFVSCPDFDAMTLFQTLIRNSVQAKRSEKIDIFVEYKVDQARRVAVVEIRDNGVGIPQRVIDNLGTYGNSYGKSSGKGLGIYHAYDWIKTRLNGEFKVSVNPDIGSTLTLSIPYEVPPGWSCQNIYFPEDGTLVVLDDSQVIHEYMRLLLKQAGSTIGKFQIEGFKREEELLAYLRQGKQAHAHRVFFLDYFLDIEKLSIDQLKEFDIFEQTTICTAAATEADLLIKVKKYNLKLCSKSEIFNLPFQVIPKKCAVVHVEDDEFWIEIWKSELSKYGLSYVHFPNYIELKRNLKFIPSSAKIVLDVELEGGISGTSAAVALANLGYSNLYLSTGYKEDKFQNLKKEIGNLVVLGKHPNLERLGLLVQGVPDTM